MKLTRVSLQSKLDELLLFFHTYSAMKITRVSLQSKRDELMSLLHTLTREIRVDNDISSSSFDCSETRIIFIAEYVSKFLSVHPASIAMIHTLPSSIDTCVAMTSVHPASIAVNHALFSSIDTRVAIESFHPASIAVKHALYSSNNKCQPLNQFTQLRLQ